MTMIILLGTLLLTIVCRVQGILVDDSIEFLNQFVSHHNGQQPTALHFYHTCSSTMQRIKLQKSLPTFMVTFNHTANLETAPNTALFLIDLECADDVEAIEKVNVSDVLSIITSLTVFRL